MYSFGKLNELLDSFLDMGVPYFDIEVRHHGEVVMRRSEGYSDYEKKVPVTGKELYNIYSCSKPITCVCAMTLFEKKKFDLDDKLSKYMPEFDKMNVIENGVLRPAKKDILIRHLFTMSAGLTYDLRTDNIKEGIAATGGRAPTREMMKYIAKDSLIFDPGYDFNYSLCHDVIAALVEICADMPFNDYVKKAIFDKVGMENTTYLPDDKMLEGLSAQYRFNAETKQCDKLLGNVYRFGPEYASGGAGCVSTVDDYMKFLEGMRTDAFVSDKTLALMCTHNIPDKEKPPYPTDGHGYGLGMRCPRSPSSKNTDFGWGGAAGAFLACDKVHDFTVYHAQHLIASPNQAFRINIPALIREELTNVCSELSVDQKASGLTY